jgi:hypothetical protein
MDVLPASKFDSLRAFVGGMAIVFANTTLSLIFQFLNGNGQKPNLFYASVIKRYLPS